MQIYKTSFQDAMNPYMTGYLGPKRSALGKERRGQTMQGFPDRKARLLKDQNIRRGATWMYRLHIFPEPC